MKKLLLALFVFGIWLGQVVLAQDFSIIPQAEWDTSQYTQEVLKNCKSKSVNDCIAEQAKAIEWGKCSNQTIAVQLKTWLVTRNSIVCLLAYLLKLWTQLTMLIGMFMIIYAWYNYALSAFWKDESTDWQKKIKNVAIWIFIISISYWLYRLIDYTFLQ